MTNDKKQTATNEEQTVRPRARECYITDILNVDGTFKQPAKPRPAVNQFFGVDKSAIAILVNL